MSRKKKIKVNMLVSKTERQFLEFCRKVGYAEGQLCIMEGEPVKLLNPVKSVRFDVVVDKKEETPLTENRW